MDCPHFASITGFSAEILLFRDIFLQALQKFNTYSYPGYSFFVICASLFLARPTLRGIAFQLPKRATIAWIFATTVVCRKRKFVYCWPGLLKTHWWKEGMAGIWSKLI